MKSNQEKISNNKPTTPVALDVLCCPGMDKCNRLGNEVFNNEVFKFVAAYSHAETKKAKMSVSKAAYHAVSGAGVRFLKRHPLHGFWYVADQKVGRDKIGHFLRYHRDKNMKIDASCGETSMYSPSDERNAPSTVNHYFFPSNVSIRASFDERNVPVAFNEEPRSNLLSVHRYRVDRATCEVSGATHLTPSERFLRANRIAFAPHDGQRMDYTVTKSSILKTSTANPGASQMLHPLTASRRMESWLTQPGSAVLNDTIESMLHAITSTPSDVARLPEVSQLETKNEHASAPTPSAESRSYVNSDVFAHHSSSRFEKDSRGEAPANEDDLELFDNDTLAECLD